MKTIANERPRPKTEGPDWRRQGMCSDPDVADPDLWFAPEPDTRRLAQHLCLRHCPVLAECREHLKGFTHRGVVVFGVIWAEHEGGKTIRSSRAPVRCYICHSKEEERKPAFPTSVFAAWR